MSLRNSHHDVGIHGVVPGLVTRHRAIRRIGNGAALGVVHLFFGFARLVVGQTGTGRVRRPTMTFSFRPRSSSRLPMMAASVSTRVVSWKEAAEMKESVDSEALVIPSSTLLKGGELALGEQPLSLVSSTASARPARLALMRSSPGLDDHAAQHLANDHLDVLVVDLHALQTVDVLHFVDDVARQFFDALQAQDVLRIGRPSTTTSPLLTTSPSCTRMFFPWGSALPNLAVRIGDDAGDVCPGVLCRTTRYRWLGQHARSLGERVRTVRHTRQTAGDVAGLLAFASGDTASTSPGATSWPSRTWISAPTGKPMVTEWSVPRDLDSWPLASSSLTCGRTTLEAPTALGVDHHRWTDRSLRRSVWRR